METPVALVTSVPEKTLDDIEAGSNTPTINNDENVVDWDGPQDPRNPLNWSARLRYGHVVIVSLLSLVVNLAATMMAPGMEYVVRDIHITSQTIGTLSVTIYLLGFALGPLIISSASEMHGRLIVYHVCNVLFIAFIVGTALSKTVPQLLIFRVLSGIAGSAPMTIGGGTIADVIPSEARGPAGALFALGPLMGPVLGPVIGAVMATREGWRWTFWLMTIMSSVISLIALIFLRETHPNILLSRKADGLRRETGNQELFSKLDRRLTPSQILVGAFVRTGKLLIFSPVVLIMSVYVGLVFGLLYLLFTTITPIFQGVYGFGAEIVGLAYLGIGIGELCSLFVFGTLSDRVSKWRAKSEGRSVPEHRLILMIWFAPSMTIGFFIYGWTAYYEVHWIAPIIGTFFIGFGAFFVILPAQIYLVDVFGSEAAASALGANILLRCLFGAFLPLAGTKMYETLNYGWGNTLLGFLSLAFVPAPMLFYNGSIRVNASESRYVDSGHWASILDSIAELKDHLEAEEDVLTESATPASVPAPEDDMEMPLLYSVRPASKAQILDALPPKQVLDRYIAYYFNSLDLAAGHCDSHWQYEKFWESPADVPVMWLGLLYSIMCMAVMSSDLAGMSEAEDPTALVDQYREKTAQCLILGRYANGGPYTWETLYQYVVIELSSRKDLTQTIGILHGLSMNLLLQMGYHRDPSHFPNLTPFEGEIRRRSWVKSMEGDLQMSLKTGIPRRIGSSFWDTKEPRNLHDSDFDEDTKELPPSKPETEVTAVLQLIGRSRMLVAVCAAVDLSTSVKPRAYSEVLAVDQQLRDAEQSLPPPLKMKPLLASVLDPPQLIMHRHYLNLMFRMGEMMLHRKYLNIDTEKDTSPTLILPSMTNSIRWSTVGAIMRTGQDHISLQMTRYIKPKAEILQSQHLLIVPNLKSENDRLDFTHALIRKTLNGELYLAPLEPEKVHRILDIGTGTGIWAIEMGDLFEHAEIVGNDLSAIQPECNLSSGGWAEFQDYDFLFKSDDDTLKEEHHTWQWNHQFIDATVSIGRESRPGPKLEAWVRDAGFKNIHHRVHKWPIGPWAKDPYFKDIGMCNLVQLLEGLEAFTLRVFCGVLKWPEEKVLVLLAKVRAELKAGTFHAYGNFHVVYGQKL
ncbi:hypothetical protein CkaCkLH20_06962 [Colletotrichum karsti]|uniref:Major facilitator superfamily (MFS) profile domain-containing protein n=1 Tax=Colletotrichum karsti TaxID=1095194 RepID=A0A9P6LJW1_9PEZI|nr:uncharacterized protein CkaCkLH20_06962 [Colletotrichum karsti]KAF9875581.1 hypothetical protein CkaCkLH20_06962 [Colletotrichum karsti]